MSFRAGYLGAETNRRANQRAGFAQMNIFDDTDIDFLTFGFKVEGLPADQSSNTHRVGQFVNEFQDNFRRYVLGDLRPRDHMKRFGQQPVASYESQNFTKDFIIGAVTA